jgi:hypothetical protein
MKLGQTGLITRPAPSFRICVMYQMDGSIPSAIIAGLNSAVMGPPWANYPYAELAGF